MSDAKPGLSGLFISSKGKAGGAAPIATPLSPKDVRKRWMYVGGGATVLLLIAAVAMHEPPRAPAVSAKKAPEPLIDVTPKNQDKQAFEARYSQDLEELKRRTDDLATQLKAKDAQIDELKKQSGPGAQGVPNLPSVVPPPPLPPVPRGGAAQPPAPSQAPAPVAGGVGGVPLPPAIPSSTQPSPGAVSPAAPAPARGPQQFDAPVSKAPASAIEVEAKTTLVANPSAGEFGLGFVPVSLLNGLDAGTSQVTQSNPMPVLMNVTDHMTLPGLDRYRMKNCFLLGSGYGELSAERVYIRVSRISCVDKAQKLAVSAEVSGVVNDSDGKLGLRGMVQDRQGARLHKSVLAGFAQGLTQALAQGQGTQTVSPLTGAATNSLQGSAVARAAGLTGMQSAANQLAEFYLKEAQSIFPVISVDAGRTATVMFTGSTRLAWKSTETQFVQSIKPGK